MKINPDTDRTGALDMMGGATGPITEAISRRRSHRRQWQIFERVAMVILDAWLVYISFELAYSFREYLFVNQHSFLGNMFNTFRDFFNGAQSNRVVTHLADIKTFRPLEIGIVVGLIIIFAFRGLYKIRLTGSWFRQVWAVTSSATIGLVFLTMYYFLFPP